MKERARHGKKIPKKENLRPRWSPQTKTSVQGGWGEARSEATEKHHKTIEAEKKLPGWGRTAKTNLRENRKGETSPQKKKKKDCGKKKRQKNHVLQKPKIRSLGPVGQKESTGKAQRPPAVLGGKKGPGGARTGQTGELSYPKRGKTRLCGRSEQEAVRHGTPRAPQKKKKTTPQTGGQELGTPGELGKKKK